MLRNIFVLGILVVGGTFAIRGPFYSLLLYLWLAYFRPDQWLYDDWVGRLNLSFVIGIWTLLGVVVSREKVRFNLGVGLLGLFILHGLVSTIFATHQDTAWFWWVEFFKWILITYVIVVVATDVARFRTILLIISLSLGFEAAKQGWVSLILNPGGANINENPMLGDNNGVAVGMLMLVPVLTMLGSTAAWKWERWLHRFVAVGVLNRAITTYSRGGFLACLALAFVYASRSTRRVPAIAGIVLAAVIIVPVLPDAFWHRMNTIKTPDQVRESAAKARNEDSAEDESSLSRLHFWNVAVRMANDHPIFGVGFNSYNDNYDDYDDTRGLYGEGRSVHSTWFGVLAELGYPGLLLLVAQLVLGFAACRRARRASKLGQEHAILRQFAFALEAGLVVFIVGGSFLPFQYTEMLWHWFGLSIALDGLACAALQSSTVRATSSVPAASTVTVASMVPDPSLVPAASALAMKRPSAVASRPAHALAGTTIARPRLLIEE